MATTSKKFRADEINSIVTNVHETLPVTGSLVVDNNNVKSYGHDRYISVYDADPTLASANQLMDISYCSKMDYDATPQSDVTKDRLTMYNQFSQVLSGFNTDGSLKGFHVASGSSTQEIDNFFVVALPRYLVKDKLDGKDFKFEYGEKTITVSGSSSGNSPAGEFYELQTDNETTQGNCGILYVEAGIVLISIEAFDSVIDYSQWSAFPITMVAYDEFRGVFEKMTFKNTVEVNSTIYTCQVSFGDFNYSNNPTFTDASGLIHNSTDKKTYITGIGLHGPAGELLATAKLSKPKEKTNAKNYLFNVRLDY